MLVSFLVFGQISYFPCGRILVSILRIFGPIYRLVIPTFFSLHIVRYCIVFSFYFLTVLWDP